MLEQFRSILENSDQGAALSFLRSLDEEAKRKLAPDLKKLSREYNASSYTNEGNSYQLVYKGNEHQRLILLLSSFVCCTRQEFEKTEFSTRILEPKQLKKVVDWYCPGWFSDYVNKIAEQEFVSYYLNYEWVMEMAEKGILIPGAQLVVKILPSYVFEPLNRSWQFKPENILRYPVTLKEHIWYLFELESNIHYSNRWLNFENGIAKDKVGWEEVFLQYTSEGKIDRTRLLNEALLASNRNFNKTLSGWFIELFLKLDPSIDEIITLQKEMFSVLGSRNSKPVNSVLLCIRKIIGHKGFDAAAFLDNVPLLFTSSIKNTITTTLGLLEKLAKNDTTLQLPICKAAVQVFSFAGDELQARAAKLIIAYQDKLDDDFVNILLPYQDSLMSSARRLLEQYLSAKAIDDPLVVELPLETEDVPPPIVFPETIDDLVFFASQAFDNNQSWHFDVLPAAIIKWQSHLHHDSLEKLSPALQRALKMTRNELRAGQGNLDHMLAIFLIDVCIYFCRRFPDASVGLKAMFKKFDQVDGDNTKEWLAIGKENFYLTGWDNQTRDSFFTPHKKLLLTALQKITEQDDLPLLSTPTHEPAWIAPEALVKRLSLYHQKNKVPFNLDYQVAVSRCRLTNTTAAIELAKKELIDENRELMLFLLGKHTEPVGPFVNTAVWMCASLALKEKKTYDALQHLNYYRKDPACYTGRYDWQPIEEIYEDKQYDHAKRQYVTKNAKRKILKIRIDRSISKERLKLRTALGLIFKKPSAEQPIFYDDLEIKGQWVTASSDIKRLLLLIPNNPEPLLAEVVNKYMKYPTFFGEEGKRIVVAGLQTMYEIWTDLGSMAYLFLANSMLSSDKTATNIAGEIWIKGVSAGIMDNAQLGKTIGILESIEFAPLKRFTDLVSQNLFKISPRHNKGLLQLIELLLQELPDIPIKNLKKLLEIFSELQAVCNWVITEKGLEQKLNTWKQNAGLQKLIVGILG